MTEARGLTLHEITDELAELVEARENATTDAEQRECDDALALYLDELTGKVDRIIGYVVDLESAAVAAKFEADRLKRVAEVRLSKAKRIKAHVLDTMRAKGYKRLEGNLGRLRVQANGGQLPLEVDAATLPEQYFRFEVRLSGESWNMVQRALGRLGVAYAWEQEPDTAAIRKALAGGEVPGAWLGERGEHLRIE